MTVSFQEKLLGTSLQYQSERFSCKLSFTLLLLSKILAMDQVGPHRGSVKVYTSSKQGQPEYLHQRAGLEAEEAGATQSKGQRRWDCGGTERSAAGGCF